MEVNSNCMEVNKGYQSENKEKESIKVMSFTDREYKMMEITDREKIIRATDLTWQAGYTDFSYCRKCLSKLEKWGYVASARDMYGRKCYYLTGKGLAEVGKPDAHVYEMSSMTNHELTVARVATYLCITQKANVFDMMFDAQLKPVYPQGDQRPDILFHEVAYEIELNHKRQERLEKKVRFNDRYTQQIWVVPQGKRSIARNLEKAAKATASAITILWLEDIEAEIESSNVHHNQLVWPTEEQSESEARPANGSILDKYALARRERSASYE